MSTRSHRSRAAAAAAVVVLLAGAVGAQAAPLWSPAAGLAETRDFPAAVALTDGRVLVAGGYRSTAGGLFHLATAELYDPVADAWAPAGPLAAGRMYHSITRLANGKVLVVGGIGASGTLASAELYDPATNAWSSAGTLASPRANHTATLLADGRVLVAGGAGADIVATAELYSPSTNTWTATGSMAAERIGAVAARLPDGRVLVAGGSAGGANLHWTAELYDPATGTWASAEPMPSRRGGATATTLADGKVLVAGGDDGSGFVREAQRYDPVTGAWSGAGMLNTGRAAHTATLLSSGRVLVAGGRAGTDSEATAELFDPVGNRWMPAGAMTGGRTHHAAAPLAGGRVLVAGGFRWPDGYLASAEVFTEPDHMLELAVGAPRVNAGAPVDATISGFVDDPAYVDVLAERGGATCAATSAAMAARANAVDLGRATLPAGAFEERRAVPTGTAGAVLVCAYLYEAGDPATDEPLAVRDATVAVVAPTLDLSLARSAAILGATVPATVAGAMGEAGHVDLYAEPGATTCASTGDGQAARAASELLASVAVGAGGAAYAHSVDLTPDETGVHRLCAYLYDDDHSTAWPPLAGRAATLTVADPTLQLTLSATSVPVGASVTATMEGEAGRDAYLDVYADDSGAACAATSAAQDARPASDHLGTLVLTAGPYRVTAPVPAAAPGDVRVCAYLYDAADGDDTPPRARRDARLSVLAPAPVAPRSATSTRPPVVRDVTRPRIVITVRKQRLRSVLAKGLRVGLQLSEAGRACAEVRVSGRTARSLRLVRGGRTPASVRLGSACVTLPAPGARTVDVRLSKAATRALRKRRGVSLQIAATGRDGAGNTGTAARTIAVGR